MFPLTLLLLLLLQLVMWISVEKQQVQYSEE
jgi:hypothetical protein